MLALTPPRSINARDKLKGIDVNTLIVLALILAATIYSYHAVLGNFFHGDDFVHLSWLSEAIKNPDMIWRNFYSAWLDISTARFYRPLISLFMVSDYLLWHGNGTGFHVTNLVCHLINTILIWRIILDLPGISLVQSEATGANSHQRQIWALSSAALFALYPLHPEAVSWITGRVDTIVTMFCLASFFCFRRWQLKRRHAWLITSFLSMIFALLSKEMAVVMPALFTLFEVIYSINLRSSNNDVSNNDVKIASKSIWRCFYSALSKTALFWLILAGYIIVRRLALGTFIGGYDDSLFAIPSKSVFIKNWLHSVGLTLVPMNKNIFGAHSLLKIALKIVWIALLIASAISGTRALRMQSEQRRHVLFLFGWLILSLLPIFKLFNIADDLQGSRLVYFGSVPLSALICFGFAYLPTTLTNNDSRWQLKLKITGITLLSLILSISALMLIANNLAWQQAGEMSQAVVKELDRFYNATAGDPPVYLVGLPDNIAGAYVCRNALAGMTKAPQISRSVKNCFMLTNSEHSFPYGFARESIHDTANSTILRWSNEEKVFRALHLPANVKNEKPSWVQIPTVETLGGNSILTVNVKNLPCWPTDILTLKCEVLSPGLSKKDVVISLMYTNDWQKNFSLSRRIATTVHNTRSEQIISFPLHGDVDWSLGGFCHQLKFLIPKDYRLKINNLEVTPLSSIMPLLSFSNTANENKLGYIELNQEHPSCQLSFDVTHMQQASSVCLEISKPNTFFDTANSQTPDSHVAISQQYPCRQGHIGLHRHDFPGSGIYQARLRALDQKKTPCGFAGDQIMITVGQ